MATHTTVSVPQTMLSRTLFAGPMHSATILQHWRHRMFIDAVVSDGKIVGTTKVFGSPSNVPKRARVRLYRDRDGVHVDETWSDEDTGAYEFLGHDMSLRYTVLAYDPLGVYRAVVANGVMPERLP